MNPISANRSTPLSNQGVGQPQGSNALGKDEFLMLLTTQLSQQDPLNPMDNTEFVAQLSQFASLEQLQNMAVGLESMAIAQTANTSAGMVSYVGKDIEVAGGSFTHSPDSPQHDLVYQVGEGADRAEINILDEDGKIVRTIDINSLEDGRNTYTWDGTGEDGLPLEEGEYSFEVKAWNIDDESVEAVARTQHTIEGVSFEGGYPRLMLSNGEEVMLSEVLRVL